MKKTRQYYKVFEICLNQIFSGDETVESVLVTYPEFAEQLRPELEAALWIYSRREVINMRPGYLVASRQRLVDQIKLEAQDSLAPKKSFWAWKQLVYRLAFVALFIMISVLTYTGGSQAVNASLPGDHLYSVKLAVEDVQLSLAADASAEAELRLELADRRAREAIHLLGQGRYIDAEIALSGYRKNISIAADLVNKSMDDPSIEVELAQKLASTITAHNENFAAFATMGEIPSDTITMLVSITAMNDEITQTVVLIFEKFDDSSIPIQASATASMTPTFTPTPTSTSTLPTDLEPSETTVPSETPTLVYSDTPEPSDTLAPTNTLVPSETPQPSETPAPVIPTDDDDGEDEPKPTKKPTKTPKPKKPTKTPKDK